MAITTESTFELLISSESILNKIKETALQIDDHYEGDDLTIVMVMKGAICLTSDLIRQLKTPTQLEFLQAKSYGQNGSKRGTLEIFGLDTLDIYQQNVLLVDDIFDSGHTLTTILDKLKQKEPKSLKSLVLLQKNIPRETAYTPDFTLFHIDDHFIVGFGLDYKEQFRHLPGIYCLKQTF